MRIVFLAGICAAAALVGTAGAQGVDWGSIIQTEAMNSAVDEAAHEGAHESQYARSPAPAAPTSSLVDTLAQGFVGQTETAASAAAPRISASYKPTAQVRQKLAQIMGDAAASQSPAQGEEMRRLVLSGEAVAAYEKAAPKLGLRANDAIDGYTFYMLAQWSVANDYRPDVTPAQVAGVRRQAANAYAKVADQVSSDALRQEFGEMLVIQGAILAGVHEAAVRSGDDAATAKYAALARQGGEKVFDMDPTLLTLTDDGFRREQ